LNERAGQLLKLPRSARLASPQANRDILDPHRLARLQHQVANDAVSLVEQAQHGDSLGHRRNAQLFSRGTRHIDRNGLVAFLFRLTGAVASARQCEERNGEESAAAFHAYSGFQAS
jgi:hypothetical protein